MNKYLKSLINEKEPIVTYPRNERLELCSAYEILDATYIRKSNTDLYWFLFLKDKLPENSITLDL